MPEQPPKLSIHDLKFEAGGNQLLDIKKLSISSAGPTMILGPNGAGKSLFLRLLHGLIEPASGTILFNGQENDPALRKRQAMVFQTPVLLRRSVAANLSFALKVHGIAKSERVGRVASLLGEANLAARARQPARTLSGGEQQRLALVRALCHNPDTLFLDEPTSSLDPGSCRDIETLIAQASKSGTKVIMVTHDLGSARRMADDIVFMNRGKALELTPAQQFFAGPQSEKAQSFLASKRGL